MKQIVEIDVNDIRENPDNPRTDLGDLSELTQSIKESGVMQNLTVVPGDGSEDGSGYTAVIGHRRLAAAKIAGLKTVPCYVVDLTPKEQISMMLAENIQRNNLTPFEQAQGFQLFMDLGADLKEIIRRTGLSESTVRHRLKLTELDQDVLKEKSGQQIFMKDYIRLEEIKDPELRNEAFKKIGESDFGYAVERAKETIEKRENAKAFFELLKERCIEVQETPEGCRVLTSLNRWAFNISHIPFGRVPEGGDLFYKQHFVDSEDAAPWEVTFYIKAEDTEEIAEIPVSEERIRRGEAREKIQSLFNASVRNVKRFLTKLRETECRAKQDVILQYAIRQLLDDGCYPQDKTVEEVIGTGELKDGDDREEHIIEVSKGKELRTLAIMIADPWDGDRNSPVDYAGEYSEWNAEELKRKYEFLEKIGYKMSPEEKQVIDGTHEAYIKED